ncbi:hypothetical protein JTB14_011548 [Gonioctena quinquepunctata]|nr:hypothetical protein JTB14_011548 [Gonioctena quinquepunctata]
MTQRTRCVSTVDETIIETIINRMMPKLAGKFNDGIERLEKKLDSMEENMNGIVSNLSRLEGLVENMKISIINLEKTKDKNILVILLAQNEDPIRQYSKSSQNNNRHCSRNNFSHSKFHSISISMLSSTEDE